MVSIKLVNIVQVCFDLSNNDANYLDSGASLIALG